MNEDIINYWNTREPFTDDPGLLPDIPITDKETYQNVIIPNIIRCGGIPKKDLVIGGIYSGSCRNSYSAKWNGTEFIYKRYKFGTYYEDSVNHFEDDDGYDLFIPIKLLTVTNDDDNNSTLSDNRNSDHMEND